MEQIFISNGQNYRNLKIHVGNLPSGTLINIHANAYNATRNGPNVLIIGGMHGDEVNGVEVVRQCIFEGLFKSLKMGSVVAIPILNVYGFINYSRESPYGKDVNRSFPGSSKGSLSSSVASAITKNILPAADIIIDLHTGGDERFNFPQVRISPKDIESKALAEVFGAPLIVEKPTIPKSLRRIARQMGKSVLVFEGGESLRYDSTSIQVAKAGIRRVLSHLGMLDYTYEAAAPYFLNKTTWRRASKGGLFKWIKKSGDSVSRKEIIGKINDPLGAEEINVLAPKDGIIIGHQNKPVVGMGEALFNIGYYE